MEAFIFKQKKKMDEVKQKEKVKELQDKYIPFLEQLIRKLKNANAEKSREAQLKKMQSLYTLLKDKPKTLTTDILDKTEQVLKNLYQKLGPANSQLRAIEGRERDDPQSSKALALRPNMDVELRNSGSLHLETVKQKLLHVNDASKSMELDGRGRQEIESVLKQKASAIIGEKVRPVDPRLERQHVTSEIRFSVNRISTVISSRTDRAFFNPLQDPRPPEGYPIPLSSFQTGHSVDLYCRRTQDKTFYQRRYPPEMETSNTLVNTTALPALPAPPVHPESTVIGADTNILSSPPLSSDDIQSLMAETNHGEKPLPEKSLVAAHPVDDRLALKYAPHPKKSYDKSSSHLPIDASGNITVSLDDPRLKKPIPPRPDPRVDPRTNPRTDPRTDPRIDPRTGPRTDPRMDPRLRRPDASHTQVSRYDSSRAIECSNRRVIEGPNHLSSEGPSRIPIEAPNRYSIDAPNRKAFEGPNRKAVEGPNRKAAEARKTVDLKSITYETNNPAPPKKAFNPMERRSELDDDYMDVADSTESTTNRFEKLKSIESVPREKGSGDSSAPQMKSQFDKMYRKNDFAQDYDKHVKNINQGIKDFKIPKKALPKADNADEDWDKSAKKAKDEQNSITKEKKLDKTVEKKKKKKEKIVDSDKKSNEENSKKNISSDSSDSEKTEKSETAKKTTRRRIKIIDTDSESDNSDIDSATLLSRKDATTKKKKPEKNVEKVKKVSEEDKPPAKKKSLKKKVRAVSEEKSEGEMSNGTNQSKASTPEPVSSTGQLDSESSGKFEGHDVTNTSNEAETSKDTITKEWLEGVLANMLNPNNVTKDKLMDIMKNVLDEKKFAQVKSIMESDDEKTEEKDEPSKEDKNETVSEKADPVVETEASDSTAPKPKPRKKPTKKKTSELDKLNEDIRTMFISEGVLTATGRRMCTELRKKTVCYTETSPPMSPKGNDNEAQAEVDPPQPVPGPSKKGRKRKATDTAQEQPNQKEDASVSDLAKKLNINRMLKVELKKLKDSEIPQNAPVKKGKKKAQKTDNDAVSDSPTPPKKKIRRRNSIWFRNPPKKKGKNARTASSGNETDSVFETTEPPPPPKKRPGPKSKTQIQQPAEIKSKPAPMDIDVSAIKKEPTKQSFAIKNTDPSITALNHKSCKICTYSGKQIVTHYVKDHPLNEVFCSRLPRNISDFLKKNEKGMLYAESYNMKLNYAGSKIFGHCIFCREEMYEQPNRWITHFTKHTGEFEYICSCNFKTWSQKVMRAHVKKCEERGSYVFNEIVLNNEQFIKAFMCGDCNYLQLLEENVRNHIITEHTTCPKVHKVILLNFCDESVKKNHQTFLEMYKHNMTSGDETQEGGVFKSTDEKENEPTTSKSIFDDISKSIPNESGSGIANKLHERFGEMGKGSVVIKTEDTASEELLLSDMTQTEDTASIPDMGDAPMPNAENPIEYDDDEWEDIESDSDESVMSQSGRSGPSKKLARLAQKIGAKGNVKRKSETMTEDKSPKKTKTDLPSTAVSNEDQSHPTVICKTEFTATEFYKVENFQYQIVNDETQYHCLMPKCMFISPAVELFIDHLIKVHDDDTWSGYCDLCKEDKFPVSRSMITEFHHLVNDHPWKKPTDPPQPPAQPHLPTPTVPAPMVTEIKEEVKPTIRLRRLSGDKLSVQSDDSFKIPTTPTTLRSVTIRRVSQSPDLSRSSSPTSGSPPTNLSILSSFSSPNFNAQSPLSRSILIRRTNSIDTPNTSSTSTAQIHTVPASSLSFSMTSPIRSPTFSISTAKPTSSIVTVTSNANAVSVPAKISLRRSTISTDILPGVLSRVDMMNELKPWIKQPCCKVPHAIMRMLQREVLYAPFKCMGTECWFFTTNEVEMAEHLRCHDQISEEQSERATITDTSSWLECAYCDYMAGSRNDLMMHLKKEHLYCEYICPKCFFRACTANYVARHLQVYHKTNISVLHIKSDYVNNTISNPVTCVKDNVQLLLCKTCNLKFLNYVHFEQHINNHASHSFDCGFCSSLIPNDYMKKHMFCHMIGNFECIYCEFASNNRNSLAQHMCDKHPNRPLLYYNREEPQEQVDKFKLSTFDDFCQFRVTTEFIAKESLPKTSNKAPVCIPVVKHTSSVAPTLPTPSASSTVAANQESMPLVILNVVSLNEKSQSKTPPTSSLAIKDVCTLSRDNPGTPLTITSVSGSSSLDQHSVKVPETTPSTPSLVLEAVTVSKEEFEKQSFDFSTSLSRAIADWVSKTGVPQTELLKCSEMECDFQGKFKGDFLEHIDRSHPNALLKCPQCVNVFWHASGSLWSHLETHGQKRYFCLMCDYTGKTESQMVEHCTKTVHKWIGHSVVPITNAVPGGAYVVCPRNTSAQKIEQFKADFVRNIQKLSPESRSTETVTERPEKDAYGPEDIDKLPTKPVVKNVYCKLCDYKTMIVKNLVRHFDAHRQAVYVPNLDPVNPVPCLNSNEKNFDKMTNLACSSNMDNRSKSSISEPMYVVQQKRFVCGVGYCSYITIDETMLKYHLSTLHSIETSYKCPHCHIELLKGTFAVDTIIVHYRLHGEKLFMCDKCQYINETTQNVEKHIKTVHSGTGHIYVLRDETRSEASNAAATDPPPVTRAAATPEEPLPKKWICNECNHTTYLKSDMAAHVLTKHGTKYQYQCGYCNVVHLTRSYIIEHIKARHGDKVIIREAYAAIKPGTRLAESSVDSVSFWRRDKSGGAKSIRGIPCESSEILPRGTEEEEEEEEYASEDDYPEQMATSVIVAPGNEEAKKTAEVEDFMPPVKQRIERIIQCNLCEKTTKSALTMQVVHFPECHPGVPVSTRVIAKVINDVESGNNVGRTEGEVQKLPKGYKIACYHCPSQSFETLKDYKKHYVDEHTEEPSADCPPCLYHFVKTMYCGLCQQVCSTYNEVGVHLQTVHKTESVIAKSSKDGMVCGACDYDAGDDQNLLRHAKLRHTNQKFTSNISQAVLDDMLKIQVYPMKRCTACREIVCDIDGRQSEEHLRTKHSASGMATFVSIRNPTFICGRCHQIFDSETNAFTHILTHTKSFKCSACARSCFAKYEEAHEHMKLIHAGDISVIQFSWPIDAILESLMVFPNGLVLSLEELQMTKYKFDQGKFKMMRNEVVRKQKATPSELLL